MIKWGLGQLPELKVGDCLAFEAEGWQKAAVAIIGAETFHWAMCGERLIDDEISVGDHAVADSISKGITTHLLSEYSSRHMRVYRPKLPPGVVQEILVPKIIKLYCYYGTRMYDWIGVLMVATWCLLRKLGFKVRWWEHDPSRFYCLEFDWRVWKDLGYSLVPEDEPPYPGNMERSRMLELIWSSF